MLVLGYDVETTGLDTSKDSIIEVGAVVWDTDQKLPIDIYSKFISGVEIKPEHKEAMDVNGIKPEWLEYGYCLEEVFCFLDHLCKKYDVKYLVAHNGAGYDVPISISEASRLKLEFDFLKLPLIDTRYDLPFTKEPKSRSLNHLALDQGFLNPFSHRAVFDVLTMCRVMSAFEFDKIIAHSKIPWVIARALVDYDNKEKAKEMRFSWEKIGEEVFPKCWVKKIKEDQLEIEQNKASQKGFKIVKIK